MDRDYISNYTLAASSGENPLPEPLQHFYDAFKDRTPGEYTMGIGAGVDSMPFGPVTITVDNTRVSVIYTENYESATNKNLQFVILQGYAQLTVFDRFYASCILIGQSSPADTGSILALVDHLTRSEKEREELEKKKIDEVKIHPAFYAAIYNDPINQATSTYGIYVIADNENHTVSYDAVFQGIGIADFADNSAFGLAVAIRANVNTFTNAMDFSIAGSLRFADSQRFTIAGEVGLRNGKLNAIGFSVRARIPVATEIYLTQGQFSVKGFQEPKISISLGGGMAFGPEMQIPSGLGIIKKALFPNLERFFPLELTVNCAINPMRNYYSLAGQGLFMGNLAVSACVTYDDGDWDAEMKAGTVRNNYLNGSLSVDYHKRKDNWNLHGNFSCSIAVDFGSFLGIMVSGGVDLLYNSRDYTIGNTKYNRKDLTISVSGMGKVKVLFSFNVSVQKTWVFNLSNTRLTDVDLLVNAIANGESDLLADGDAVMVCESEDIVENELSHFSFDSDVIEAKSWQIDGQCSASGIVRFQVAAEYTLAGTCWRLTHSDGDNITVYTSDNSEGVVTLQEFTHNYYELHLDTPDAGSWLLEITGDSRNSGGIYMDALQDEKFITALEIVEQTSSAIRFRYTAFTGSGEDTTLVRLWAEEISPAPDGNPYSGIIAYLEETEDGEFLWEIPEEFCHNSQYRFYLSAASSDAATVTQSSSVEAFIARQRADLECSWELVYSSGNADTVTAYITITNTGSENTACQWQVLDHTNNDSVDADDSYPDNTAQTAEIIASGICSEIKGNSSVVFQQVITVSDELRDNPSFLQLTVTQCGNGARENESNGEDETFADDADEITFVAVDSMYCQEQRVSWENVEGAASYVLNYALEGDWEEGGVYINNIYGNSYTLSLAPGEYFYRVIALGSNGENIGSWSEEKEIDVLFSETHNLTLSHGVTSSRSQTFTLNDGIYLLNGSNNGDFSGTLTLFRNDLVKIGEENDSTTLKQTESEILSLEFVNGTPTAPPAELLLDNGDYFWVWDRSADDSNSSSEMTIELSGEVFSMEQSDREIISIGDDEELMPLQNGVYTETLKGEVGFCNADAIYQYMTDDGGELTITIRGGTVFEAGVELNLYVQNCTDGSFDCVESLSIAAGEYADDSVILERQVIKNNFYVQVASRDNGRGEHNTDYSFDLSFDAFEDAVQSEDILPVNGDALRDWIGYRNESHTYLLQPERDDFYAVRLEGDAFDAVLKVCELNGNIIEEKTLQSDGTAYIDGIRLERGNYFVVVESTDKGEGSFNTDYTLSASDLKTLFPQIDNSDDTREMASQQASQVFDTEIGNWLGTGDRADFFKFSLPQTSGQISSLLLTIDEATAREIEAGRAEIICCDAWGQALTVNELSPGQWRIDTRLASHELYIGIEQQQNSQEINYSFKVTMPPPEKTASSADGLSWEALPGASGYIVEYSADNFATVFSIETSSSGIDHFALPAGTWQWQVKATGGTFATGDVVTATENCCAQKFVSEANGIADLFFTGSDGLWGKEFAAEHQLLGEVVPLTGLNRISNVFEGSEDANVLVMTDDENGDALFADDIYTAQGEQLRLAQINEIRAGAGNDIVDMTSSRYEYTGSGITVYGGYGNDTIWSSSGENILFGDAGNDRLTGGSGNDLLIGGSGDDRMHGGGGEDIFLFGAVWGSDIVEQSAAGSVILWFENGSVENWNEATLTYSCTAGSVTVSGVDSVTLRFGSDPSLPEGAFAEAASTKIFKDHLA